MRTGSFVWWNRSSARAVLCLFCFVLFSPLNARNAAAQSPQSQRSVASIPQLDASTRADVAEKFAQALADDYAYADKGAAMAAAIRAKLSSGAYNNITSPTEFAAALQRDARAVVDDHHLEIGFNPEPGPIPMMRHGPPPPDMRAQMRRQNGGIPEVKILDGNIGYIVVNGMLPDAKDAVTAAFAFVHDTDALILDLRGNSGGAGPVVADIMSYLRDGTPRLLDTLHWRNGTTYESRTTELGDRSYGDQKPVFILTSHQTFSAAEALAYDVQSFKRGAIVGETTGGGANPSMSGASGLLGHGFVARIPTGYVVNAVTGTNWEGVGVKPDVAVPPDDALAKAWSLALVGVSSSTANPQSRALLDALSSAKLDGQSSLPSAQLVGRYVSKSGDATMTITQEDGELLAQERYNDGETADITLRPAGGDRYLRAGFPDGFSLTFAARDGKIELIQMQPPPRESSILEKQ